MSITEIKDSPSDGSVACVIMCRNEEKRIHVTLESVKNVVSYIIVYDTGSEDKTIEIITKFCTDNTIKLVLKRGEFINFEVSRNVLMEECEKVYVQFLLLLDVNDELRGEDDFKKLIEQEKLTDNNGYSLRQNWAYADGQVGHDYYNTRLVKNNNGWIYHTPVHEYISSPIGKTIQADKKFNIILYQDRSKDDDKSSKRFVRDKVILLQEYKKNPTDSRTLFYLAQTCCCLNQQDDGYYFYKKRAERDDFIEEKYHACVNLGDISLRLNQGWDTALAWYMKAYEIKQRAEPLINISRYYMTIGNWYIAYLFISEACELEYPTDCLLFVNKKDYEYERWHLLGRIGFYAKKMKQGKRGCVMALIANPNSEIDKKNCEFYK